VETLGRTEINYGNQKNNKSSNSITIENNSVSLQKQNGKFFRHLKRIKITININVL